MTLQKSATSRRDEAAPESGERQFGIGRIHRPRSPLAASTDLASGKGQVHSRAGRLSARDCCLVLVRPSAFETACTALRADGEATPVAFPAGEEPAPLRALLGGGVRELAETHGARRVLIAASGRGAEEQMLELTVDAAHEMTIVSLPRLGLTELQELGKRAFDLFLASLGLAVSAPLFLAIALLVKLSSSGPILFRQIRIGRDGRPFEMLKFRTMVADAEARKSALVPFNERDGLFKIAEDPRITPIGRRLRQSNLDELPQLFNVLRGQMSLVGPRPLVPDEDACIRGWRRQRLEVRPGMTGCWQVLGSARVSLDEMIMIDCLYIANWSLWGDLKCVLFTAPSVLRRRGV
jgi:lipopolysaccharide/colanic/teichoic acid biosynthesis glycosyltransferase